MIKKLNFKKIKSSLSPRNLYAAFLLMTLGMLIVIVAAIATFLTPRKAKELWKRYIKKEKS